MLASANTAVLATTIEQLVRQVRRAPEDSTPVERDADLFDLGLLDSLALVRLVRSVENTFGITLSNEALFSPQFTSINGIATVVAETLAADT